jgi:Mn2+/Fe2+ NRAMP family transporter
VRKIFQISLGILTAFGGFVDAGDFVANAEAGARFEMSLAWVVVLGVVGICLYAEMSGRVAAVSKRPVFDLVRERLGARMALVNLVASFFINFLTLTAEIAGIALVFELATSLNYLLWIPLVAVMVWLVVWKVKFSVMEKTFSLMGLLLVVIAVAVWKLGPDWGGLLSEAAHPTIPPGEGLTAYLFFAVALFGAAMTPYEVFFFSSGAIEEGWTRRDLLVERANVFVGFPLGGILSIALMASGALVLAPRGISVQHLSQGTLPTAFSLGKAGLAVILVGIFGAFFSAALETSMSAGYSVSQFFGWQWGKFVRPTEAPRFHLVTLISILLAAGFALTTVDPIKVTEYSIVLSAAALPLTYFPILIVANDPRYLGNRVNSKLTNGLAFAYLVLLVIVSLITIPVLILSKGGA